MGIWMRQGKMEVGKSLNTAAITSPKIARTMVSARNRIARKRMRVRGESTRPEISPTVCPLLRIEMTSAPKSCTAPMKIDPNNTHSSAGSQPQITASAGPTMGPVPAIEVKW